MQCNALHQAQNQNHNDCEGNTCLIALWRWWRGFDIYQYQTLHRGIFSSWLSLVSEVLWKKKPIFVFFADCVGWAGRGLICIGFFLHASIGHLKCKSLLFIVFCCNVVSALKNWIPRALINIFAAVWYFSVKLIQRSPGSWAGWNNIYSIASLLCRQYDITRLSIFSKILLTHEKNAQCKNGPILKEEVRRFF